MEGFMVNTTNVNNCANDIQGYGDRIKGLKDSVSSIRLGMRHKLSARGQIERTLRGIEDRMLDEAALMSSLDQVLAHIAEAYRRTERGLVTEGIRRSAGGQAVTEQQQAMMDQYMQAAIGDILQEDQFSQEAWTNASIEERKELLDRFLDRMEKEMGISLEDIQFRSGEDLGYNGAYNYEDNYIAINEALLKGDDPRAVMSTLVHEGRHAYQHAVCENPNQFLVTADTIQGWQDSSDHYREYLRDGKYSAILSEVDAHNFAGQELPKGHVLLTSGMGDGAEMYNATNTSPLDLFLNVIWGDKTQKAAKEQIDAMPNDPFGVKKQVSTYYNDMEYMEQTLTGYEETMYKDGYDAANKELYKDMAQFGGNKALSGAKADIRQNVKSSSVEGFVAWEAAEKVERDLGKTSLGEAFKKDKERLKAMIGL